MKKQISCTVDLRTYDILKATDSNVSRAVDKVALMSMELLNFINKFEFYSNEFSNEESDKILRFFANDIDSIVNKYDI